MAISYLNNLYRGNVAAQTRRAKWIELGAWLATIFFVVW